VGEVEGEVEVVVVGDKWDLAQTVTFLKTDDMGDVTWIGLYGLPQKRLCSVTGTAFRQPLPWQRDLEEQTGRRYLGN
jgi:hypothetical protein